jgi:hypothetical protein
MSEYQEKIDRSNARIKILEHEKENLVFHLALSLVVFVGVLYFQGSKNKALLATLKANGIKM